MAEEKGISMYDQQQISPHDPALEGAVTCYQMAPGYFVPRTYNGIKEESTAYQSTAWIGTALQSANSPIVDIVGPQAIEFMQSICTNDFSNLGMTGLRHAVICNERGEILTDGVAIRIAEDRIRTYWLNPPIEYLAGISRLDVHAEDMTGTEYFIQVQGEKSLEILEDAFGADLHDIKFAKHRLQDVDGMQVQVVRLGMTGNLAYEIHGPMSDYADIYNRVWASGKKFGAQRMGLQAYNLFNHTEGGFPNINVHYPLPWFESGEGLANWCLQNPQKSFYNLVRKMEGSMGDDAGSRFVNPYDAGMGYLVKFNHDFIGREALEEIAKAPKRTCVTLEWNPDDVGKVYAAFITPGGESVDDISRPSSNDIAYCSSHGCMVYHQDKVIKDGRELGFTSGRIISYNYHAMISLAFIDSDEAVEGSEVTILWGTPGTKQMEVRAKVAPFPYNKHDIISNQDKDVEEIPHPVLP